MIVEEKAYCVMLLRRHGLYSTRGEDVGLGG